MNYPLLLPVLIMLLIAGCESPEPQGPSEPVIKPGAQVLLENHLDELGDQRLGLVMNPTARVNGTHMLDTLLSRDMNVTALFAAEHGFRGQAGAGEFIRGGEDAETGLPVFSLYGDIKQPTEAMLNKVDVLLFDMQDVGARFYTYNATMGRVIEAAVQHDVEVWVLDRPNPAGGEYVEGWMLDEEHESFVGQYPTPMVHGMTLGELARMIVGEQWIDIDEEEGENLRVIPMEGWTRDMKWYDTGLSWYPPSPNLPTFNHSFVYLGTVLFEGTNLSEGRGTDDPFLTVGAPETDIDDDELEDLREAYPAVEIEHTRFIPRDIPGKATHPKYANKECLGVEITLLDADELDPVRFGWDLLRLVMKSTPGADTTDFLYKLAGQEVDPQEEYNAPRDELEEFRDLRGPYLLY
jgi:uncharacterized protein YbbC (DUF1343 family)